LNCDFFITQSFTAQNGIIRITKLPESQVKVISNILPPIYTKLGFAKKDLSNNVLNIACVCLPHPNKNIEIIPLIIRILKIRYGIINVKFHLTLPEKSPQWLKFCELLEENSVSTSQIVNWGYCSQERLISLYSQSDLFFLPTLLETFTASLLEAMYFGLPIITTDFSFNKEITKDAALYYEPMNPFSAAEKIVLLINDKEMQNVFKKKTSLYIKEYQNYEDNFGKVIQFLKECAGIE
jgi:glycosyltransferase involved in cell wall biosynthesis